VQLADFGLTPAKAAVTKTSAERAIIAAKAKLTRQARGTTSKKQKAAIKPGVGLPAVGITPTGASAPASTTGSGTPASS
jgi:hypothetical protein